MQQRATIERLVAESRDLYTLPAVAVEVLELTADPTIDSARLKACLLRDPALVAKLLRVVNSSLFGLTGQVSDLGQALTLLGTKPLKLLVLGFSLPPALTRNLEASVLTRFWKHSLTKAVAARELSRLAKNHAGDDAFLAALLSDLGQLALIQALGQPYAQVLERVYAAHRDLGEVERHVLGFDHAELTVQLLATWRFPAVLVEAIDEESSYQRREDERKTSRLPVLSPLGRVLHLAELLARLLADEQSELLPDVLADGMRRFDLTEAELYDLCGSLGETVGQLADALSLGLPRDVDYLAVLERAHLQLAQVAADAAIELLGGVPQRQEADTADMDGWDEVAALRQVTTATPAVAPRATIVMTQATKVEEQATAVDESTAWEARLHKPLLTVIAACRAARRPLSLLLGAVTTSDDDGDDGLDAAALNAFGWPVHVERFHGDLPLSGSKWLQLDAQHFAMVLPACDRSQSVEFGQQLVRELREARGTGEAAWTIRVGIAAVPAPSKNLAPERLVDAARRCVQAARAVGGCAVKSIEIL